MEKLLASSSTSSSCFESISAAASISLSYCYPRRQKGRSFGCPCFLDACHRCKKRIGDGRDIYMYRGDVPFCSEECRQLQIEVDEAEEQQQKKKIKVKLPAKVKAKEKMSDKSTAIEVRAVTTAVACT